MSDKYCLAGKVECEYSCRDGKACYAGLMTGDGISPLLEWKIYSCVYPHLRRPPKIDWFAAGRLAGLKEAREAVDKVLAWRSNTSGIEWDCHAALDRLMEDGK